MRGIEPQVSTHEAPMRVRSDTNVPALAGAIANALRKHGAAELHAIGAGAVNQAVKAIAAATNMQQLSCVPTFGEGAGDDERTFIRFTVRRLAS